MDDKGDADLKIRYLSGELIIDAIGRNDDYELSHLRFHVGRHASN